MGNMRIKVLLIEDDKVDQMAFVRSVKEQGLLYDYTVAGSVSKAKMSLDSGRFDIIVADYHLGDGNAFDVLDLIADTPIIVITGAGNEELAVTAMKKGAYDYLIKDSEHKYLKILPTTIEKAIERKKIEDQNKILLRAIMDISDSIYITDINNKLIFVNKAFCRTYGYKEEEVIGRDADELLSDFKRPAKGPQDVSPLKKQGQVWEDYGRRKDGRKFPIFYTGLVVKDKMRGIDLGKVRIVRDVTEKKRLEEEREKLINELQMSLAEIKTLRGFLPICTNCKKICDDKEYSNRLEDYIHKHPEVDFTDNIT